MIKVDGVEVPRVTGLKLEMRVDKVNVRTITQIFDPSIKVNAKIVKVNHCIHCGHEEVEEEVDEEFECYCSIPGCTRVHKRK